MKIVVAVSNSMNYDQRVLRQLSYFSEIGHEIIAVGVLTNKDKGFPNLPKFKNVKYVLINRKKGVSWFSSIIPNKLALFLLKLGIRNAMIENFAITATYLPILRQICKIKADLYYANDLDTTSPLLKISNRQNAKFVYDAHEYYEGQSQNMPEYLIKSILHVEKRAINGASTIITVSDSISSILASKGGRIKPTVVRNIGQFIEVSKEREIHSPVRLIYQTANLALSGRNLKILVDAISLVKEDLHLTLRGRIAGENKSELIAYLDERLKDKKYNLLDAVPYDKLIREASENDIGFILNAPDNENHKVTLPNKIFEYMNAGLAIISFDTIELNKIINKEKIGFIVTESTSEALAQSITKLIRDKTNLRSIKIKSFTLSQTKYNWNLEKFKLDAVFQN